MRFARSNNAAKRQPERATPWHRMLKDVKDDDDEDSNEAAASSTPSDLAPKRKSVEPDEEDAKAKVSKVEGAADVTTKATPNAAKKDVEDVSDDEGGEDEEGSEDGDEDDPEGADEEDDAEGGGDSEDDEEEEEEEEEDAKPAKKSSAKGNGKGTEKPLAKGAAACFKCRREGHSMKDCPSTKRSEESDLCYKCGSAEHFSYNCKIKSKESMPFATCFVCNKKGHVSRSCPQKSEKHFESECLTAKNRNKQKVVAAERFASNKSADLDENLLEFNSSHRESRSPSSKKTQKTVKF